MIRGLARLLAAALMAGPAAAQEFITFDGPVDAETYYRAVSCAAPPGGDCQKPLLHWPAGRLADLRVGLVSITPNLPGPAQRRAEAALDHAIRQINLVGSPVHLMRDDVAPDIGIHIVPTPPNHPILGTGVEALDGRDLELGLVLVRSREGVILDALIAISAFASAAEIGPVVLEEVTQSLGFLTDLRGPGTELSVFGEDTNAVRRLSERDAMAIRRHYPAP